MDMLKGVDVFVKLNDGRVGYSYIFENEQGVIITENYQDRYTQEEIGDPQVFEDATQKDKKYISEHKDVISATNEVFDFWCMRGKITEEPTIVKLSPLDAYASLMAAGTAYVVFREFEEIQTNTNP
jgi:hypothetical protein